ncbi:MAG: lipid-A-disaccharide synthase [Chthoniobacter sp.]|jgi:lipid-A-disaccharide synthase|nr:lipid-A-disaccharide synthase [Chthoniobacter sp.]
MKLYFVAGEASGDARGAELMRSIRERAPDTEFCGLGGAQMATVSGGGVHDWSDRAGVIGFIDVLKSYPFFKKQFDATLSEIGRMHVAAVVLIDYPGFNIRLATALKKRAGAPPIFYYVSPQVWAWHRSRIPKMARVIDLMMCIFPFEKSLYEKSGLKTIFVGHPMLDSLAREKTHKSRDPSLVGLFPGSRKREVRKIFPVMLGAAERLQQARPELHFEAAAASDAMHWRMQRVAQRFPKVHCPIVVKNSHELMQRAAAGMVASGTATMEAAFFQLPFVVVYRAAWLTFFLGRKLVSVEWLGMPNILAGREIVREFLQEEAKPEAIAEEVLRLLNNERDRAELIENLDAVVAMLGSPGASGRAADAVLAALPSSS